MIISQIISLIFVILLYTSIHNIQVLAIIISILSLLYIPVGFIYIKKKLVR